MKERQRCTSATTQRIDNMKLVIETMRKRGTMHRDDIALVMSMSASGGRKYIRELLADDIIMIVSFMSPLAHSKSDVPVYGLNKNPLIVDAFLERLAAMPRTKKQRRDQADHGAGPRMQKVMAEDGRQVHMLRDDVEHKPRSVPFVIPAPDPLLAALFGFAGAA